MHGIPCASGSSDPEDDANDADDIHITRMCQHMAGKQFICNDKTNANANRIDSMTCQNTDEIS